MSKLRLKDVPSVVPDSFLRMAFSHNGMVNTDNMLVTVIKKSAKESFPLQERTRAAPTPRVVGATANTASPAPNSGGVKGMATNAKPSRGVIAALNH